MANSEQRQTSVGRWIGVSLPRFEDARLVTGAGRFVDDLAPDACLHVEFVRSSHARGTIAAIDTAEARAAPGVVAVFTGAELGALGEASVNPLLPDIRVPRFSVLASGTVEAVGQPLAAVIAETAAAARDAAQLVAAEIEAMPLRDGGPDDEAISHRWAAGDVEAAFAGADHIVHVSVAHARLAPAPLEPRAALAKWSEAEGLLTVWLSTQTPHRARQDLARILGLPAARLRVIAPDVGGAFGGKASIYPEDVFVAWAARRLGRPVKWCATRGEDLQAATHGRGGRLEGSLALDRHGRALALRANLDFPLGHWLPYSASAPGRNAGRILPGPYRIGAVEIALTGRLTNTAAVGIYRGAGRPEAAMLMERLMDAAARALALDPAEIRRRNLLGPEELPFRTATGETLDSGDYPQLLARACERADYARLREEIAARRAAGEICGIGLALYVEPCGQGWESATVSLAADGGILAATGATAQGQGRETAIAQIVASGLGVPPGRVRVRHGDTAGAPEGIGALASRSTAIGGSAMLKAVEAFRDEARRAAAKLLQCAEAHVAAVESGFVALDGTGRAISWQGMGESLAAGTEGDTALSTSVVFYADGEAWSSGCCICVVGIDGETGVPTIERLTWVDDAGTVLNPMLVEGQLVGGMAQGMGEALMESLVYDEDGQLVTGSFMDYAMPRAADVPPVAIDKLETPSPTNPLGAKGVGEAGTIGVPAAIVNAVLDALSPYGVTHLDMPLTSQKIWKAIRAGTGPERPGKP
ncbi:carbon-monoxide dehydrogenase large subunit [Chelatococcus caeni]|uniref:Carbon-monoxide dehydrogenase large subunit n=1 Tax=Chelatococcus caeni TaxID=1348468 RepID=A0A840BZM8_9HYPH|nr:xanthine dehydrogenase family protein molybdopterin-binding subunit [Chelatococcus caeni]MBB4018634.1 carbon-monoxide dehydrogenase large subunit [Chelatococcus caeni]